MHQLSMYMLPLNGAISHPIHQAMLKLHTMIQEHQSISHWCRVDNFHYKVHRFLAQVEALTKQKSSLPV